MLRKRKLEPKVGEEKKQSIETELEVVQMLDLAGKDYNVGFTCYRNKRNKRKIQK